MTAGGDFADLVASGGDLGLEPEFTCGGDRDTVGGDLEIVGLGDREPPGGCGDLEAVDRGDCD